MKSQQFSVMWFYLPFFNMNLMRKQVSSWTDRMKSKQQEERVLTTMNENQLSEVQRYREKPLLRRNSEQKKKSDQWM